MNCDAPIPLLRIKNKNMKKIQLSILLAIIALCFSETAKAQVLITTEYISSTSYHHDDYPDQIGEGGLKKIQAALHLPVSVKVV